MNTRLVPHILILAFIISVRFSWAEDVEVISITSLGKEEFARKQAELNKMLSDGALSADDKVSLEQLRQKSIEVAALNEECKSFDISSIPNERCKTFYRIELPNFEEMFGRITGDLYLNRLGVVKGLKERKDQIKSCIGAMAAFLNPGSLPQNLVKPRTLLIRQL